MKIHLPSQNPVENAFVNDRKGFLLLVLQLALLGVFTTVYKILDKQGLPLLLYITLPAFILNAFLPVKWRPVLLTLLFWGICLWSLSWVTGGFIIFVSLALFVCAELPIKLTYRVILIAGITAGMIVLRNQWFFAPRAIIAVPYIASLFMFRMVSYLYYKKRNVEVIPLFRRLNYFFLLPNLVFLLFPIIDYRNYVETYYARPAVEIYRKGIFRITMGIVLLIIHRIVYYYWSIPPADVRDLTSVISYNFISYFLIIQIVGMFQVCVGWVTLFGYDLNAIFENFFFAKGFSDLWRKINHYWRDFILKTFYFPIFFRLRKIGQYQVMVIAGLISFFFSWMMHSQQLYWISGHFSFTANDAIYWMTMGIFITADGIYQYHNSGKNNSVKRSAFASILIGGLRITGIFLFASLLWTLWNADSLSSWFFLMKQAGNGGMAEILSAAGMLAIMVLIAGIYLYFFKTASPVKRERNENVLFPVFANVLFIALLAFQFIATKLPVDSKAAIIADEIHEAKINEADREIVDLGYYDQMVEVGGISRTGWQFRLLGDLEWGVASGATHPTGDVLLRVFNPNAKVLHHGYHLNINHMGLRDKEYTDAKPAGTIRWAFCGGSYVLGPGVEKEFTFEAMLEEALNDSLQKAGSGNLEILNFSNGGYLLPQTVELCRKKVFQYQPDYVFYFAHPGELEYTPKNISRLLAFGADLSGFPEFQKIIDEAGLKQSQSRIEMMRRMEPYQEELIRWGYKEVTDMCKAHNAQPVWVFFPTTTDGDTHAEYIKLSKIAEEYGFITIDLSGVYGGYKTSTLQNSEADSHPIKLGHKLIATKLEGEIRKKILVPQEK
ncbi:MAG: hypothetical protein M3R17_09145 [Bacteroidota bacterium]|nr:hypothetical protein [Bacteroidota bacterium]